MFGLNWYNTGVTVTLAEVVASGTRVWDFDYPTPQDVVTYNGKTAKVPFDKAAFEQKILDHYMYREIGMETVGLWLHHFRSRIREIMPYYVQMYEFEAKWHNVDDPLESYNLREEYEHTSRGTGTAGGVSKFSDTPQGSISNLDSYLTNATQDTQNTENTGEESSLLVRRGNIGVQPLGSEVRDIREAFINIDQMVINDLKDLFVRVY